MRLPWKRSRHRQPWHFVWNHRNPPPHEAACFCFRWGYAWTPQLHLMECLLKGAAWPEMTPKSHLNLTWERRHVRKDSLHRTVMTVKRPVKRRNSCLMRRIPRRRRNGRIKRKWASSMTCQRRTWGRSWCERRRIHVGPTIVTEGVLHCDDGLWDRDLLRGMPPTKFAAPARCLVTSCVDDVTRTWRQQALAGAQTPSLNCYTLQLLPLLDSFHATRFQLTDVVADPYLLFVVTPYVLFFPNVLAIPKRVAREYF